VETRQMTKEKVMSKFILFIIIFLQLACGSNKQLVINDGNNLKQLKLSKIELKSWHHKDIIKDSIPGISLDKAYQELVKNKKGKDVLVAVIDSQTDLFHVDLKESFWINKGEIPNNNIDDDDNGYIDDVNGWNFIGNKKGESVFDCNFEYVRIVKKYKGKYLNINKDELLSIKSNEYNMYINALNELKAEIENTEKNIEYFRKWEIKYNNTKTALKKHFPKGEYTLEKLKSIKTNDKKLKKSIKKMIYYVKYDLMDEWLAKTIKDIYRYKNYYLNIDYDDRALVGDNPNDINDKIYGYNNVGINQDSIAHHATYVSGILASNRENKIGIRGVNNNIKIMPIVISCNGDEHDKDIALAIRYAVDNGAKIINMSSGKEFSLHKDWVHNALEYASSHDVLFVTAAGNSSDNVDEIINYPNDNDAKDKEFINNFINVGSSTYHPNKKLVSDFSNYGKKNVDLFAPGENIYTTNVNNNYRFKDGTSFSTPIVSGVAALIWSYYPNLKASEIKDILLESGVTYDIDVELPSYDEEKKLVPFSSLSKSGKIVNAYNALLYAKNYKKWKQGKWPKNK
jgi:subtilisin family serine protease